MALVCLQRSLTLASSRWPSTETGRRQLATTSILLKEVFKRDKPHMNIGRIQLLKFMLQMIVLTKIC